MNGAFHRPAMVLAAAGLCAHACQRPPPAEKGEREAARCSASGWSVEQDPGGLNVRAAPTANAPILGRLHSVTDGEALERGSRELFGPSFRITEVRGDWIRIEGAEALSEGPTEIKRNYVGTGWVHAARVRPRIAISQTGDPTGAGYAQPDLRSRAIDPDGLTNVAHMRGPARMPRIVACAGPWLRVQYRRSGYLNEAGRWIEYPGDHPLSQAPLVAWFMSGTAE